MVKNLAIKLTERQILLGFAAASVSILAGTALLLVENLAWLSTVFYVVGMLVLALAFLVHGLRRSSLRLASGMSALLVFAAIIAVLPGTPITRWAPLLAAFGLAVFLLVARGRLY
jgi:hypothetical protein